MKLIPLSTTIRKNNKNKGKYFAQVDDEDFERVNQYKWTLKNCSNILYAKNETVGFMHRFILGLTDSKILGDHKNHNGLDNQKHNLRECTISQNNRNRTSQKNSSSKYLGVSLKKSKSKTGRVHLYWLATISDNNKQKHLGYFKIEEDAALKYDEAARMRYGEFANLNFK